ncbi:MAG: Thioesterase superfamily [Cyanobacteriota bacterium]|jgi:acyl-coenzyme A thioesterase PaaI-like protein
MTAILNFTALEFLNIIKPFVIDQAKKPLAENVDPKQVCKKLLHHPFGAQSAGINRNDIQVKPGSIEFKVIPKQGHTNGYGTCHAGYLSTLLDEGSVHAAQTIAPEGTIPVTSSLSASFIKPVNPDQPIEVENKIIALDGEKSAVVASTIKQGEGEPRVSSLAKITFYRPENSAPVLAA